MAKNEKPVLGMIDCPHCGEVGGMAVKHDKNLEPFGHCDECSGQLRVGGKPARVRKFCRRYPWAAAGVAPVAEGQAPAAPAAAPVTVTEPAARQAPPPAPPVPARKRANWADGLTILSAIGR